MALALCRTCRINKMVKMLEASRGKVNLKTTTVILIFQVIFLLTSMVYFCQENRVGKTDDSD